MIASAVLIHFTVILTVGMGLHNHGHRIDASSRPAAGCTAHGCCAHAAQKTVSRPSKPDQQRDGRAAITTPRDDATAGSARCLICQLLTEKPWLTDWSPCVGSTRLVQRTTLTPPPAVCTTSFSSGGIRGPPATG